MKAEGSQFHSLQLCRSCGGGAPVDVHFCPQCSQLLTLGRQGNYFTFMGLERRLNIEPAALEQRFRSLSRQFHPDFFYNATPAERRASLERSSYLNDAYRTLRDPVSRVEYLLGLEGFAARSPHEASKHVPKALLEEVFALNEELDEIRELRESGAPDEAWRSRVEHARLPIVAKQAEHESQLAELSSRWDTVAERDKTDPERLQVLEALRDRVVERAYIQNLLDGVQRELDVHA